MIPSEYSGQNYRHDPLAIAKLDREPARLARTTNTIYVNDFYPTGVTASRDGATHPLSAFYGTLAEAEAAFPHLDFTEWSVTLADEVDWCAWQSAADYCYNNDPHLGTSSRTFGTWCVLASGVYRLNKSIVFTSQSVSIIGETANPLNWRGGATALIYSGAEGTDTAKVAILDCYPSDETNAAYPGRFKAFTDGGSYHIRNIWFGGRDVHNVVDYTAAPGSSGVGYVIGVRIRNSTHSHIENCGFGDGLFDGIWVCSNLYSRIEFNFFYGVYRDCVSFPSFSGDISTTMWIDDNEFGFYGRYAILLDLIGAVEPSPSVCRNSIEGPSNTYYYHSNLDQWVQGVRSSVCQIGGTYGNYHQNRCEQTVAIAHTGNMWGDLHLAGVGSVSVRDNRLTNVVVSGFQANPNRQTAAYDTFKATYDYVDINAERNFNAGYSGDIDGTTTLNNAIFDGGIIEKIINVDNVGISNGSLNYFRALAVRSLAPVTFAGTYIRQVRPPGHASTTMGTLGTKAVLEGASELTGASGIGPTSYANYNYATANGSFQISEAYPTWATATAYVAGVQASDTGVSAGGGLTTEKWVFPLTWNGCIYECTVSGTSHASTEPTWPTTVGNTVTDGTVTWKCVRALIPIYDTDYPNVVMVNAKKHVQRNTAAPTTGNWGEGDVCWIRIPDQSTPAAWVCITAGAPGTWIPTSGNYGSVALSALPAAATANKGCRALVTDSNATLSAGLGNTVASGGANIVPVYSDGSNWKIG
jgi:hypothetical protein